MTIKSFSDICIYESHIPKSFRLPWYDGIDALSAQNTLKQLEKTLWRNIKIPQQYHSDSIVVILPEDNLWEIVQADALLTLRDDIALWVIASDCVPILLYEKKHKIIGAIHAGRKGSQNKILQKTIQNLQQDFGTHVADISLYIWPRICQECYELSLRDVQWCDKKYIKTSENPWKVLLDICQINIDDALEIGVLQENIELSDVCTYESQEFHSYRRYSHTQYQGYGNNLFAVWREK